MQLFLLRHGDALLHATDDESRPLSPLGEHQALIAAQTLSRLDIKPQTILSSPLTRADQTARIVMKEIGISILNTSEYLTPISDPRQIIRELTAFQNTSVLLVGHLPNLQILASLLTTGSRQSGIAISTGTLALIEIPLPVEYGKGMMRWLLSYDQMKKKL